MIRPSTLWEGGGKNRVWREVAAAAMVAKIVNDNGGRKRAAEDRKVLVRSFVSAWKSRKDFFRPPMHRQDNTNYTNEHEFLTEANEADEVGQTFSPRPGIISCPIRPKAIFAGLFLRFWESPGAAPGGKESLQSILIRQRKSE